MTNSIPSLLSAVRERLLFLKCSWNDDLEDHSAWYDAAEIEPLMDSLLKVIEAQAQALEYGQCHHEALAQTLEALTAIKEGNNAV